MIFLFIAVLCSASIALLFKYSESNGMNRYAITSVNYMAAFLVSLVMVKLKVPFDKLVNIDQFKKEFVKVIIENQGTFSDGSSIIWAVILGIMTGVFYFLSFIFYQKSVKENGASLSGVFSRLGMLIPMLITVIVWREYPTIIQWSGIILAIIAVIIINISPNKRDYSKISFTLILLFLFSGMGDFANKIFQNYTILIYKELFLFIIFFTAFILSLYITIKKNRKITKFDILIGLLVGLPNLFSSYFLILALDRVPTSLAFPIYSAGSIVFISFGSVILFKEKISKKDKVALLIVLIALVLMNI
jgi:drug/metabolite transporter (DMT)-like permease